MFINSVKLKSFKPFSLSNIQQLTLNSSSDTQIFIGDNGSGKSSLLNEVNPYAAIKPTYNKKGLKEIVLTHKGDTYILTSDFSSTAGHHSFQLNGEELNISGTSGIQNELAEYYLGYTSVVHDITHMNYLMCSMSKTERKTLLLDLNPVDLSIVLDKHKTLCSRLREFKNNLSLLHKKKQEVETQLLTSDVRKSLALEKDKLTEIFNSINSELYHLKKVYSSICSDLMDFPDSAVNFDMTKVKPFCNQLTKFLTSCTEITNRETEQLEKEYTSTYAQASTLESEIDNLKASILTITQEIETYVRHIQDLGTDVTIDSLQKELVGLKNKRHTIDLTTRIIPDQVYDYQRSQLLSIIDKLYDYHDRFRNKVPKQQHCDALYKKNLILQSKLSGFNSQLDTTEKTIIELQERLNSIPQRQSQFELSQLCNECEYYNHFESQLLEIRDKLKTLEEMKTFYTKKVTLYTKVTSHLSQLYHQLSDQMFIFSSIVQQLSFTVWNISYEQLQNLYLRDFNKLIQNLQATISESLKVYENNDIDKSIEEITSRITYMMSTGTQSIDILKELAQKKQEDRLRISEKISASEVQHSALFRKTKKYEEFLTWKKRLARLEQDFQKACEYILLTANKKFCQNLISQQQSDLDQVSTKLREIETTIQEQTSLLARLDDIIVTIAGIETQKNDLQIIEYGLSPYTGFLNQNLVDFTNVLLHNVNCILSHVWSYPLQLLPLDASNPFDGIFPIMVDDIVVPDISKLSKGQQAIVNLAWTFAFIFSRKLSDYPIYLDEVDGALDPFHKQKLLEWLQSAMERKYVSQMWLVGHDLVLFNGFNNAEILALMDNNIVQCEKINEHVQFG